MVFKFWGYMTNFGDKKPSIEGKWEPCRVARTNALISFAVTAQLICAFVFAYANCGFLMRRLILFPFPVMESF